MFSTYVHILILQVIQKIHISNNGSLDLNYLFVIILIKENSDRYIIRRITDS